MNKAMIAVLTCVPVLFIAGCTVIETNTPSYNNPYTCSKNCNINYACSGCNTVNTCSSGCNTNIVNTPNYNCGSSYVNNSNNCNYNNVAYTSGYWGSPHTGCCSY